MKLTGLARIAVGSVTLTMALAIGCGGGTDAPKPTPSAAPASTPVAASPAPATPAPAAEPAATSSASPAPALPAAAVAEAESIFVTVCTPCHGATGKGDGVVAAALDPKPRDYSSHEWQASVSDERLRKVIVEGGPAVGMSTLMPPNPSLAAKPDVVSALVAKIRSFDVGT